ISLFHVTGINTCAVPTFPLSHRRSSTMYPCADLKKGLKLMVDGEPYLITQFDFTKPGKGQALYKCKMRNMITGNIYDRTYRSGETGRATRREHLSDPGR